MFELYITFRYLLPKKKALSTAIISLLSVCVISLIVWLVLVFLSVTTGIEKNWLKKLTSVHAPIRITPTDAYYSSYYYQIDSHSLASGYESKTIGEKASSLQSDPYQSDLDMELPYYLKERTTKDLVKEVYNILDNQKNISPNLAYQDYEISSALMRLTLNRTDKNSFSSQKSSVLTQMSYLASINDKNPYLETLIADYSTNDITHFLNHLDLSNNDTHIFKKNINTLFENFSINKVQTLLQTELPITLFSQSDRYVSYALVDHDHVTELIVPDEIKNSKISATNLLTGSFFFDGKNFIFQDENKKSFSINNKTKIYSDAFLSFSSKLNKNSLISAQEISQVKFHVQGGLQNNKLHGEIDFNKIKVLDANALKKPQMFQKHNDCIGIFLPKSLQNSGVLINDIGYLAYTTVSALSSQEQRIPIYVAGFYDPGILPVGNRCLLVPQEVTRTINSSVATFSPDGTPTNGIYVWTQDLSKAKAFKQLLEQKLQHAQIAQYWKVTTFEDYEFSKDLLQQFQSDRTLFSLIAIIILVVACSNIISLLILLVNDKKKEIAVLQAMGATQKSIASIFGLCGIIMGTISSIIGTVAAIFTLKHIDVLVRFLSVIQGHAAFNTAFFGKNLPNTLSYEALIFILIATPLISLAAGLIPAIKASKMRPSPILRSE